jgi:hypothetical protein
MLKTNGIYFGRRSGRPALDGCLVYLQRQALTGTGSVSEMPTIRPTASLAATDRRFYLDRAKRGQTGRFLLEELGSFWYLVHRGLPCSHDRRRHTASCYAHAAALN